MMSCQQQTRAVPAPPLPAPEDSSLTSRSPLPAPESSEIEFSHLTVEDGLSQSTVRSILQDSQGFMWFATADGLNRYDGYTIKVFKHDPADPFSIGENNITALFEDSDGVIWIGTAGAGLNRYDRKTERFYSYNYDPDDPGTISSNIITALYEDRAKNLWIGTATGLNRLDGASGKFTRFRNTLDPLERGQDSNTITAMSEERTGRLWLGTRGGLLTFDPQVPLFNDLPLIPLELPRIPEGQRRAVIGSMIQGNDGAYWIGTLGNGLFRYQPETGNVTNYRHQADDQSSLGSDTVNAIVQNADGIIWLATENGLDRFNPTASNFVHFQSNASRQATISDNNVTSLYIDEAGILWLGTAAGGVNYVDPHKKRFTHIKSDPDRSANALISDEVWSVLEDKQRLVWIGSDNGLTRWNRASGNFTHFSLTDVDGEETASVRVSAILEDSQDRLWLGTDDGLFLFDRSNGRFDTFRHDPDHPDSLSSNAIESLYEDRLGNIWVGTGGGGFNRFDPTSESSVHFTSTNNNLPVEFLSANFVATILEDKDGFLWVGTHGGLARFDPGIFPGGGAFSYFVHDPTDPNSLASDQINAIYEDDDGLIWIGTAMGLDKFEPVTETFTHFDVEDGLPNNMVLGVLDDEEGNLWLSTNRGLSRFNPQKLIFRNFDRGDGLQALEFNRGAYAKGESGELFFGGINGLNVFEPESIRDNPYVPKIVITDFQILNDSVEPGPGSRLTNPIAQSNKLHLARSDTVFTFELSALHYSSPEENQYAYIMEGFDGDWNLVGTRRFATYTNLPPGDYTFRAIGSNSDGVWNLEGTSLAISMPYPFWQSAWFIVLVSLCLILGVYGAFRYRTRATAARTRVLEMQVAERTSEIERRRQIAEGLREILLILNSNRSLEESLHYIVAQAARLTDAEDAIIFRHEEMGSMNIVATNPGGQIRYTPDARLVAITKKWTEGRLAEKRPMIIADLDEYWTSTAKKPGESADTHKAMLGIPLYVGQSIYGGLIMFYALPRSFSEDDLDLGFTFADQAALAIANDSLRTSAEETAVALERSRLARDLHDAVTQTLFSASIIAETLPAIWESDPDEGQNLINELRQLTRGALAEMRTLLLELRPAALEEAQLPDLLKQLAEAFTGRTGIPVVSSVECSTKLPVGVRIALYRIAQESLNNVVKHARARQVNLTLESYVQGNGVILAVMDDGRGFDPQAVAGSHLGLDIIRERAQAMEANLSINSRPGQGTTVTVRWRDKDSKGSK